MHFRISSCSKNFKNAAFSIDKFSYQIIARHDRTQEYWSAARNRGGIAN